MTAEEVERIRDGLREHAFGFTDEERAGIITALDGIAQRIRTGYPAGVAGDISRVCDRSQYEAVRRAMVLSFPGPDELWAEIERMMEAGA